MPVHDWTRVEAGIFHAFHHGWIEEIARALNRGLLPADHYALPEQRTVGFGPDVLTLQSRERDADALETADSSFAEQISGDGGVMLAPPKLQPTAETDMAFYRSKQKTVTVRHVSGDHIVAVVDIVSPGNKSARSPLRAFITKATDLLELRIHLLIIDLLPRGPRDPQGMHGELWDEIAGQDYTAPVDKPLAVSSYEAGLSLQAYVVPVSVGEDLTDMPLFLEADKAVEVPLETTYMRAFRALPNRWSRVLEDE